jgi:hypothetical protein
MSSMFKLIKRMFSSYKNKEGIFVQNGNKGLCTWNGGLLLTLKRTVFSLYYL